MATNFSEPFKLFGVRDPASGKLKQISDKEKATGLADELSKKHGVTVKPVPSKFYYVRVFVPGRAGSKRVNTGESTRHGARIWRDKQVATKRSNFSRARTRFEHAVDEWIEHLRVLGRSEKTLADYGYQAKAWKDFFGDRLVSDIDDSGTLAFFKHKSVIVGAEGETRKASPRLLNQNRTLLRAFFRWARSRGYTDLDPLEGIGTWREPKREKRVLSAKEVAALLKASKKKFKATSQRTGSWRPYKSKYDRGPPQYLAAVTTLAITSLLRKSNCLGLTWDQVDLGEGVFRIRAEDLKTRRDLTIPISPSMKRILLSLPKDGDRVFPIQDNVRRSFESCVKRAGLKNVTFHSLRRTGATWLLKNGVSREVTEAMGGWSSGGSVLMSHYRAVDLEEMRAAVKVLDRLVNGRALRDEARKAKGAG